MVLRETETTFFFFTPPPDNGQTGCLNVILNVTTFVNRHPTTILTGDHVLQITPKKLSLFLNIMMT